MGKNIFGIGIVSDFPRESIISVAKRLLDFFFKLSNLKRGAFSIKYLRENGNCMFIDVCNDASVQFLAQLILDDSKHDIARYEKEYSPDINYMRDVGFCPSFYLYENGQKICSILTRLGAMDGGGVSLTNFNPDIEKDFIWYYSVLSLMVDIFDPYYGLVNFSNNASNVLFSKLQVKHLIGWITYFSKDFDLKIPDDLPDFEYVFTDKGKYLILSREDITLDKTTYEYYRSKLIDTMKFLKEQVPGYSK
jgi:hypothetical protein